MPRQRGGMAGASEETLKRRIKEREELIEVAKKCGHGDDVIGVHERMIGLYQKRIEQLRAAKKNAPAGAGTPARGKDNKARLL